MVSMTLISLRALFLNLFEPTLGIEPRTSSLPFLSRGLISLRA